MRGFFRNTVRVWAMVFSTTVACTSTRFLWTNGLPVTVKLSPPTSRTCTSKEQTKKRIFCHWFLFYLWNWKSILWAHTFSIRILSPMVGAQYPSSTIRSPAVTLYCLPITWTTANRRPSAFSSTNWFTLFIIDWHVFCSTIGDLINSILFGFWRIVFRGTINGSVGDFFLIQWKL